jgi:hypothetical protein
MKLIVTDTINNLVEVETLTTILEIKDFDVSTGKIPLSLIEQEGDIIIGTAEAQADNLAPGATGTVLTISAGRPAWVYPLGSSWATCEGRLTLESGVPVSNAEIASSRVYFTPYKGNVIYLHDATNWKRYTFSEIYLDVDTFTADKNYDIWARDVAGVVTLAATVWTNDSTRATELTTHDGVLVKSGSVTYRYLGTIRVDYMSGGGGEGIRTYSKITKRYVWNYYNRVTRRMMVAEVTSHTYNGAARVWNNSETDNRLDFVIGVAEDVLMAINLTNAKAGADGSYAATRLYLDTYQFGNSYRNYNAQQIAASVVNNSSPAAGYHYLRLFELGNHADSTFVEMRIDAQLPM